MVKVKLLRCLVFAFLFGLPLSAWANSGTPLLLGTMFHLTIGNLFLGLGEAFLLVKFYKTPWRRSMFAMLAANYFSAFVGITLLGLGDWGLSGIIDIYNFRQYLVFMLIAAYLITIPLEYGFILLALGRQPWKFLTALKASWLIQSISYVLLIAWYMLCSEIASFWEIKTIPLQEMKMPPGVMVYYLGAEEDAIYCWNSNSLTSELIRKVDCCDDYHYSLAVIQPSPESEEVDLVRLLFYEDSYRAEKHEVIMPAFSVVEKSTPREKDNYVIGWNATYNVIALGEAKLLPVKYFNHLHSFMGIVREDKISGKSEKVLEFEMPFLNWGIRNVIVLPGDKLLLQLGREQICIFNPQTMEMALIARGSGFVAVLE